MDADTRATLIAGHGALHFFDTHWDRVGVFVTTAVRVQLRNLCEGLSTLALNQSTAQIDGKDATALRRQRREELRILLARVDAAAAFAATRGHLTTHLETKLPAKAKDMELHQRAVGLAKAMRASADVLESIGLPADTPAKLEAAALRLQEVIVERGGHRGKRFAATQTLSKEADALRKYLNFIDTLLLPAIADDHALSQEWRGTRRIADTRPSHVQRLASGTNTARLLPSSAATPSTEENPSSEPNTGPKLLNGATEETSDATGSTTQPVVGRIAKWFRQDLA